MRIALLLLMLGAVGNIRASFSLPENKIHTSFAQQLIFTDSLESGFDAKTHWIENVNLLRTAAQNAKQMGDVQLDILLRYAAIKHTFYHSDDKMQAINSMQSLIADASEVNSTELFAELNHFLGLCYWQNNKQGQALEQFMNAYEMYSSLNASAFPNKADYMYDYAGKYYYFRDFSTAKDLMREVWSNIPEDFITGKISKLNTLGLCYNALAQYDSALYYFELGMAMSKKEKVELWEGIIIGNVSSIYFDQRQYDKALELILKNIMIDEKHNQKIDLAFSYMRAGEIYLIKKNHKLALDYLKKSYDIVLNKNLSSNPEIVSRIYIPLGKAYMANGMADLAFRFLDSGRIAKDTVNAQRNVVFLTGIQRKMEVTKHKAEIKKKETEISQQRRISIIIFVGLLLVSAFGFVVFYQKKHINKEKKISEDLLLNILPIEVANELKNNGNSEARQFDATTVMFTDFKNFTQISEKLTPKELVYEIDYCYKAFDQIITKHGIEKIKTIGDSYMCAGGLPVANTTNAIDVVKAALEIQHFVHEHAIKRKSQKMEVFEIRIGVHTGPVVAGIVGLKKFAYDIWGDTVNTASRMESSGEAGKVNISGTTYELIKDTFNCTYRGEIAVKGKGAIAMYFVNGRS